MDSKPKDYMQVRFLYDRIIKYIQDGMDQKIRSTEFV